MISIAPLRPFTPSVLTRLHLRSCWRGEALGAAGPLPEEIDSVQSRACQLRGTAPFHVSGLVANSVHHMHPQYITLVMFYIVGDVNSAKDALEPGHHIIGIEVDTAVAGNGEATGCLCLD